MARIIECTSVRSDVNSLNTLHNGLFACSTKYHGAKMYDINECVVKASVVDKNLNFQTAAVTFSPDSQWMAFANKNVIYLYSFEAKKVLKTIKTNKEIVELLTFDPTSNYIFVGTKNGRVLKYNIEGSSSLARICSFMYKLNTKKTRGSFVSSFAFYEDLIACSGYGGTIFVIDIYSHLHKHVINDSKSKADALCFFDDKTLLSAHSNGEFNIYSFTENKVLKKIDIPFTKVSNILPLKGTDYVLLAGEGSFISLIDIKNLKIIKTKYIEFEEDVLFVQINDENILIATLKNNKIMRAELPTPEALNSHIVHNSLDKALKLADKHPILKYSSEYKKLDVTYQKAYQDAAASLVKQNKKYALQLMNMYKDVPSKKEEVQQLFKSFENFAKLQSLYREKKYATAYLLVAKYPALEHTPHYAKIEQVWKDIFKNAQRHIILGNIDNAKALLKDYITVPSKKPMIHLLLKQNNDFVAFLKAIEKKDFQNVYALSSKNNFFLEIPSYVLIDKEVQKALENIDSHINSAKLQGIEKFLPKFENIDTFAQKVNQLKSKYEASIKLQKAYKNNDFKLCFEILDQNPLLDSTELAKLLQKHWKSKILECETLVHKGDLKAIKNSLEELLLVVTRQERVGDLLRVSFHVRIKMLMAKKGFKNAEGVIYSYIDIFGMDNEIDYIMKTFEALSKKKLAITQNQNNRPPRNSWIESKIISD